MNYFYLVSFQGADALSKRENENDNYKVDKYFILLWPFPVKKKDPA